MSPRRRALSSRVACRNVRIRSKPELALAKDAFDQDKFIEPQGESALDLYRSALALDPNSQGAKERYPLRSSEKILERAEAALLAERLEEAIRTIETARDIDSTHPRLAFLDTQVARERERLKLSQAQEIGNRVRYAGQPGERSHGRMAACSRRPTAARGMRCWKRAVWIRPIRRCWPPFVSSARS